MRMSTLCGFLSACVVMIMVAVWANIDREKPLAAWAVFLWLTSVAVGLLLIGLHAEGALKF